MSIWFEQILPYIVLVIFHLNSGQVNNQATATSRDQPTNLPQALYRPPGSPFGHVHFTKYPHNTAYSEYNLDTILIANPFTRTRETKYIGHKGKQIEVPPLLFRQVQLSVCILCPMTLPLTLQHKRPIKPPTAAKTTSTQLLRVLYITLKGLVDSMVLNSRPWSLLGQSHLSYGEHCPLAQQYPSLSSLMPLPMSSFLIPTTNLNNLIFFQVEVAGPLPMPKDPYLGVILRPEGLYAVEQI
ncbi:hypothetical protein DSO57_1014245 [Entomophthora muscae]|uniref:Uncharacterized protein n=1 Tax=Entomophthora muscae TaxID=34485 RepID=A0ACC2UFB2_9FUNG|nr:hypothetical protein DSO57_1014245 [Entomophthora muscae]